MAPVVAFELRRASPLDSQRELRKIEAPALVGRVELRPEEGRKQTVGVQGLSHGGNTAMLFVKAMLDSSYSTFPCIPSD